MCSAKQATRAPEAHEIILDRADGLDWPTLCKCVVIYATSPKNLTQRKGEVTSARQAQLVRTVIAAHGWAAVL